MIDFETFGNSNAKCIVQVGACYFNRVTGEIGKTFKRNIDANSHVNNGGIIDADTVYWWLSQKEAARKSILAEPREDFAKVFTDLNIFLKDAQCIWSHASFDYPALQDNIKRLGLKTSFKYSSARDLRTIVDAANITVDHASRKDVHHDALEDCKFQVGYAVAALNKIKGRL